MMKRKRFGAYDMLKEMNDIRKQNIALDDNERLKKAINSYCGACYKLGIKSIIIRPYTEFECKAYRSNNHPSNKTFYGMKLTKKNKKELGL